MAEHARTFVSEVSVNCHCIGRFRFQVGRIRCKHPVPKNGVD